MNLEQNTSIAGSSLVRQTGAPALVLGSLACLLLISPLTEYRLRFHFLSLALPMGIAAVVSGVCAVRKVRRGEATHCGLARAGIVLGAVASLSVAALMCWGLWTLFHV